MINKTSRWIRIVLIACAVLLAASVFSLCVGSSGIPIGQIISGAEKNPRSAEYSILFHIRLPRILLGAAAGGALSLAGVILQGMFRNPLVEPYTLGISGGAALGVCINLIVGFSRTLGALTLPFSGFAGAALITALVYLLNIQKGALRIHRLLLTGVMISFISSSLIMLLMAVCRTEDLHGIIFWVMGSLEEPNLWLIATMAAVSLLGLCASYLFCLDLNALSQGEEEAFHLGINVEKTKKAFFFLASILTGCAVSVAGIIGFVGLVIPHVVRMFTGRDHRILLVTSFLYGAAFLVFCDTVARTIIAPSELPVGILTGALGGSFFIYVLAKKGGLHA